MDKYLKIVELTTMPASNPDEQLSFARLILEKLNLVAEHLGMARQEDFETGSDISHLGTW
jgi:hypothetical protein